MSLTQSLASDVVLTDHVSHASVRSAYSAEANAVLSMTQAEAALAEISAWHGYQPTSLRELDKLAEHTGCGGVWYKDESERFGLGSFKALGGAYAVLCLVAQEYQRHNGESISLGDIRNGDYQTFTSKMMVTTATDGNHGRSVAWGAANAGCRCRIYIHRDVSDGRKKAMEAFGAEVIRIDGDYDDSVRLCAEESAENHWFVVSDTSYEGYMDVPRNVMAGYTVMAGEILKQQQTPFTHVFIQAGVGGLAAAVCSRLWMQSGVNRPRFIIVESQHADCWLNSVKAGRPETVAIDVETVMAGLSCGEVSALAWQVMQGCLDDVVTLADTEVAAAMKLFANGDMGGGNIEAGECAVPGALALMAICKDKDLQAKFDIDADSQVLLFGCEGATDETVYRALLDSVQGRG